MPHLLALFTDAALTQLRSSATLFNNLNITKHSWGEAGMIRKISAAFAGGALGGLVDSINIWAMGKTGISDLIGLAMKPEFTGPWLYQRMVWGGIWMLLLLLPLWKDRLLLRGALFSLLPSAMMLFMVLPSMGKGNVRPRLRHHHTCSGSRIEPDFRHGRLTLVLEGDLPQGGKSQ